MSDGLELDSAPNALDLVRPKILQDSVFLPAPEGILFRKSGSTFILKGRGTYELLASLLPSLVGRLTVAEICAGFGDRTARAARRLIAILLERRIVIDHVDETADIGDAVRRAFQAQVAFLEHVAERPLAKFAQFRSSRVLLTGSGTPLRSLVLSFLRNGVEAITLDERTSQLTDDPEIAETVQGLRSKGVAVSFETSGFARTLATSPSNFSAICYAGDTPNLREVIAINEYCWRERIAFLPGLMLHGKAFVGPVVRKDAKGCWFCFLLRHAPCIEATMESEIWKSIALGEPYQTNTQIPQGPCLKVLGTLVGFEFFRLATGHALSEQQTIVSIDSDTLETAEIKLLRHPLCPHCSAACDDKEFLQTSFASNESPLDSEAKMRRCCSLVDPDCGIVKAFEDDELLQIPLFRSALAMPRHNDGSKSVPSAHSVESNLSARLRGMLDAVASYALSMPGPRSNFDAAGSDRPGARLRRIAGDSLSNWAGGVWREANGPGQWKYAISSTSGEQRECLIPVASVYAVSFLNKGQFESSNAGIGVGFDLSQASAEAVLSAFAYEVLKGIARHELRLVELSPAGFSRACADARYLINALGHLGQSVRLLTFAHDGCGAVVLAFSATKPFDPVCTGVGSAGCLAQAATAALTELLAIVAGCEATRNVEYYLPKSLRYELPLDSVAHCGATTAPENAGIQYPLASVLGAFPGLFTDILIANLTTPDLQDCGLFIVKALFVGSAHGRLGLASQVVGVSTSGLACEQG